MYHPPSDFERLVRGAVETAGGRAERFVIGTSVEGRAIEAVAVAAPGREPAQRSSGRDVAFVLANIHGVEAIAGELALRLVQMACEDPPAPLAASLLALADLVVVPVAHPDGRAAAFSSLDADGPIAMAPRRNANGVDLNRNWPPPDGVSDHWLPIAGTGVRWLPWYRGPEPLSEPETRALHDLAHAIRPFAVLNLHSTGRIVTYPWSSKPEPPPDLPGFRAMVEAFTGAQKHWRYRSKQSRAWYPIVGSSNDYFYDRLKALPLTIEIERPGAAVRDRFRLAGRFFWYANPADPEPHVDNDADACFAALVAAHDYRRHHPAD